MATGFIIAEREYSVANSSDRVKVKIFSPTAAGDDYRCDYTIEWPKTIQNGFAEGVDAIQCLLLAMKKIGTDLYLSDEGKSGDLYWLEENAELGLPLPKGLEDLYRGDDPP